MVLLRLNKRLCKACYSRVPFEIVDVQDLLSRYIIGRSLLCIGASNPSCETAHGHSYEKEKMVFRNLLSGLLAETPVLVGFNSSIKYLHIA